MESAKRISDLWQYHTVFLVRLFGSDSVCMCVFFAGFFEPKFTKRTLFKNTKKYKGQIWRRICTFSEGGGQVADFILRIHFR